MADGGPNVGAGAIVVIVILVIVACGGVGWWIKRYGGKYWAEAANPASAAASRPAPPGANMKKNSPVWEAAYDEDGEAYYINKKSGEPSWEPPEGHRRVGTSGTEIPEGWTTAKDVEENKKYYINKNTGETQWERPGA